MQTLQVRRVSLAQARIDSTRGRVIVVDASNRPVPNAQVSINGIEGMTNGSGIFEFPLPSGSFSVVVRKGDYAIEETKSSKQLEYGAFIKIPVCLAQPILTTAELGALGVGIGVAVLGMVFKQKYAEVVGEVLVGSAAFTAIYRHSCL